MTIVGGGHVRQATGSWATGVRQPVAGRAERPASDSLPLATSFRRSGPPPPATCPAGRLRSHHSSGTTAGPRVPGWPTFGLAAAPETVLRTPDAAATPYESGDRGDLSCRQKHRVRITARLRGPVSEGGQRLGQWKIGGGQRSHGLHQEVGPPPAAAWGMWVACVAWPPPNRLPPSQPLSRG
jgi:hypothetical protein